MTLRWAAPKRGPEPERYVVVRNGRVRGGTTRRSFTDRRVTAGKTYR